MPGSFWVYTMANAIVPKKSSVVGKVPLATDLQVGEIAVNLADRKMYSKDSGGTVFQLGGGDISALEARITALENIITNGTVKYSGKITI